MRYYSAPILITAWIILGAFTILLNLAYVNLILPLFNTLVKLPEGRLHREIVEAGRQAGFPVEEITVMDGSKRTTKVSGTVMAASMIAAYQQEGLSSTTLPRLMRPRYGYYVLVLELFHSRCFFAMMSVAIFSFLFFAIFHCLTSVMPVAGKRILVWIWQSKENCAF
mmetsp:Transcript_13150/g.34402  ORF Transcript_13150/g.34402 Transcript_13150/m.34402 type:complete len:167 (+) Transcript_13150:360-860(+)